MYEDHVETAEEQLKRADHLVYVSLKYTRTCDVMKNAIGRMIAAYEFSMLNFLEHKRMEKKISEVPSSIKERTVMAASILGSSAKKFIALYRLLKEIYKAEYTAHEEFRKNVTLRVKLKKITDIKVDDLYKYLETTKEFVAFMKQINNQ